MQPTPTPLYVTETGYFVSGFFLLFLRFVTYYSHLLTEGHAGNDIGRVALPEEGKLRADIR